MGRVRVVRVRDQERAAGAAHVAGHQLGLRPPGPGGEAEDGKYKEEMDA